MKKQFKVAVLATALMVSVTGVFAADISNALSSKQTTLYVWQKYFRNGMPDGPLIIGTEDNPYPMTCYGASEICAIGTPISGGISKTVRYPSL